MIPRAALIYQHGPFDVVFQHIMWDPAEHISEAPCGLMTCLHGGKTGKDMLASELGAKSCRVF